MLMLVRKVESFLCPIFGDTLEKIAVIEATKSAVLFYCLIIPLDGVLSSFGFRLK